jgi:hypothetical protein
LEGKQKDEHPGRRFLISKKGENSSQMNDEMYKGDGMRLMREALSQFKAIMPQTTILQGPN